MENQLKDINKKDPLEIIKEYFNDLPMITKEDVRRLEKAAREKNKAHLSEFLKQYEYQIAETYRIAYEKKYEDMTNQFAAVFDIVFWYTLIFSEDCWVSKEKLEGFISDFNVTYAMVGKGELTEKQMREDLQKEGVNIKDDFVDPFLWVREERNRLNKITDAYTKIVEKFHSIITFIQSKFNLK